MKSFSIRLALAILVIVAGIAVIFGCSEDSGLPAGPASNKVDDPTPVVVTDCGAGAYLTALSPALASWQDSLEAWLGDGMLDDPPAYTETSEPAPYLETLVPVLQQWETALNDSLGDTVYVKSGDTAGRREVRLGLRSEDSVEVLEGLAEGDLLIVIGQDGLADGTPVTVIGDEPPARVASADESTEPPPEAIEMMRQRMKERGMSDAEIEQRLKQRREGGGRGAGMGAAAGGEIPPFMAQRIKEAPPEELEGIKERMKQFGLSDQRIEEIITQVRAGGEAKN